MNKYSRARSAPTSSQCQMASRSLFKVQLRRQSQLRKKCDLSKHKMRTKSNNKKNRLIYKAHKKKKSPVIKLKEFQMRA